MFGDEGSAEKRELFESKFGVTSEPVTLNSWNYKVIYKRITVNTVYTELRNVWQHLQSRRPHCCLSLDAGVVVKL